MMARAGGWDRGTGLGLRTGLGGRDAVEHASQDASA